MSDTVKLIIEIPKEDYNIICKLPNADLLHMPIFNGMALYGIKTGTLLDEVRTEIISKHFHIVEENDFDIGRTYGYDECLSILDNVGKAESEDKE